MPIRYTVSADGTFAYFSATGVIDLSDLENVLNEFANDDRLVPGFRQLFDFSAISNTKLNTASLTKISELARENPKVTRDSKLAIVVSLDLSFNNAKEFEKLAEKDFYDIIVFNSLSRAKMWLGVNDIGIT